MEAKVCKYQKFGFCKYKQNCMKEHLNEECKTNAECKKTPLSLQELYFRKV